MPIALALIPILLLASVHDAMGMPGVGMLRVLLVLVATGLVFATARRRGARSVPLLLAGFTVARHEPFEPRLDLHWMRRWSGRRRFPLESFGRTNALGSLGFDGEARVEARAALAEAGRDYAPLAANYAEACYRTGLRDEALVWYRRVLELEEGYPQAKERVAELERFQR